MIEFVQLKSYLCDIKFPYIKFKFVITIIIDVKDCFSLSWTQG